MAKISTNPRHSYYMVLERWYRRSLKKYARTDYFVVKIKVGSKKCFILSKILIKYALFYQNTLILYGFRAQLPPRFRKMGSHDVQNGQIPRGWFFIFIKYALFDRNALVLYVFFQKFAYTTSKMDIYHSLLMIEVNWKRTLQNPTFIKYIIIAIYLFYFTFSRLPEQCISFWKRFIFW